MFSTRSDAEEFFDLLSETRPCFMKLFPEMRKNIKGNDNNNKVVLKV
jgi:hypothetical protein